MTTLWATRETYRTAADLRRAMPGITIMRETPAGYEYRRNDRVLMGWKPTDWRRRHIKRSKGLGKRGAEGAPHER